MCAPQWASCFCPALIGAQHDCSPNSPRFLPNVNLSKAARRWVQRSAASSAGCFLRVFQKTTKGTVVQTASFGVPDMLSWLQNDPAPRTVPSLHCQPPVRRSLLALPRVCHHPSCVSCPLHTAHAHRFHACVSFVPGLVLTAHAYWQAAFSKGKKEKKTTTTGVLEIPAERAVFQIRSVNKQGECTKEVSGCNPCSSQTCV